MWRFIIIRPGIFYICIRSFEDVSELFPYLQDIDISEVYKVIYSSVR